VTLGPDDLVLCAGTLAAAPLEARIPAAAAAGFTGVSLFLDDVARFRSGGGSDADLRGLLEDHGLAVAELDPLMSWVPGAGLAGGASPEGEGFFRHGEAEFFAAADALGARSVNAVVFAARPVPEDALVEAFARLCDRAAEHGLLVHLEFLPFCQVRDADSALAIVEAAGRENGGITFDVWHHFRGGGKPDAAYRVAPRVLSVQLDDAPAQAEPDPTQETLHRRLLPGEGAAGVVELIRALDRGGCRAPLGVEVFSDELAKLPPAEAARRAGEAARRVIAQARGR
jgi:sugar phosphate isomerase/epimerase